MRFKGGDVGHAQAPQGQKPRLIDELELEMKEGLNVLTGRDGRWQINHHKRDIANSWWEV